MKKKHCRNENVQVYIVYTVYCRFLSDLCEYDTKDFLSERNLNDGGYNNILLKASYKWDAKVSM